MNDALADRGSLSDVASPFEKVSRGGKPALSNALAMLESAPESEESLALLDAAFAASRAHVIGLTGPPGVGKSTLIGVLLREWRARGQTIGVIAVDPSSRLSGGALLGDRTRFRADPADAGTFIRSMAARDRLGGLAELTIAAMVLMRALFDIVLIETVGVGQSESDVAGVVDTVVLCVQPGAGDALQFMKSGIIEIPHIVVVTKSDVDDAAERARGDATAALRLRETQDAGWQVPILSVSALRRTGTEELIRTIAAHRASLDDTTLRARRQSQAEAWLADSIRERFGREGLRRLGPPRLAGGVSPFRALAKSGSLLNK